MLVIGGAASAQAQAPATTTAGSTGKPQTTTFMQQTLGESFEDFMRGGISASVQSGNAFTANFYSKEGKPKEENALALTAAGNAIAQEVTPAPPAGPTSFRNFVLGANFNDMVSAGIVRAEMCDGKVKGDLKKNCKDLEKIRSGQFAVIVIQDDQTGRVVLNFEGAKLIAVRIQLPYSTSFELQLLELTKKYGNPTTLRSATMQNGYGATWNTGMAFWKMPDGTEIEEMELVVLGDRRVQVDFKCKERAAFGAKQMTY
jgi:hypothetical protein